MADVWLLMALWQVRALGNAAPAIAQQQLSALQGWGTISYGGLMVPLWLMVGLTSWNGRGC